jgi:hypothetical protein
MFNAGGLSGTDAGQESGLVIRAGNLILYSTTGILPIPIPRR